MLTMPTLVVLLINHVAAMRARADNGSVADNDGGDDGDCGAGGDDGDRGGNDPTHDKEPYDGNVYGGHYNAVGDCENDKAGARGVSLGRG